MVSPQQQVMKHVGDGGAFLAGVLPFLVQATPVVTFVGVCAGTLWAIYRIFDLHLSIQIKRRQLRAIQQLPAGSRDHPPA